MPFVFLFIGVVMLTAAVRNTVSDSGQQKGVVTLVKGDFTGKGNFIYWLAAIGVIGGLGYIGTLKTPSRYMMALVLIVLFLKNGGVFSQFAAVLNGEASQSNVNIGGTSSTANQGTPPLTDFLQGSNLTTMIPEEDIAPTYTSAQDVYANATEPVNIQTQETDLSDITL